MKQKFSTKWIGSKQPRKQRKYRANAPIHIRHKMLSANLSKDLRKRHSKRSFPLNKNDRVKIMRGEFKGKIGKVSLIDAKKYRIAIEGIQKNKKDGTKVNIYFSPSNVQIQELNLDDIKRKKSMDRKSSGNVKKEVEQKSDTQINKTTKKSKQTIEVKK